MKRRREERAKPTAIRRGSKSRTDECATAVGVISNRAQISP